MLKFRCGERQAICEGINTCAGIKRTGLSLQPAPPSISGAQIHRQAQGMILFQCPRNHRKVGGWLHRALISGRGGRIRSLAITIRTEIQASVWEYDSEGHPARLTAGGRAGISEVLFGGCPKSTFDDQYQLKKWSKSIDSLIPT